MLQRKFKCLINTLKNLFNKSLVRKTLYLIGIITGGGLFIFQLVSSSRVLNKLNFNNGTNFYLVFAIISVIIATGIQIIAWFNLLEDYKKGLSFSKIISGYSISFIPRYIPGNIWGYISRSEWLYNTFLIPYNFSNTISIYEVISTITANILISLIILTFLIPNTWQFVFSTMIIIGFPTILWFLFKIFLDLLKREKNKLIASKVFSFHILTFSKWIFNIILFAIHWLLMGISLLLTCKFLLINHLELNQVILSSNISWLFGFLIFFAPSGLGYRESFLSYLLTNFSSVQIEFAQLVSILFRLITIFSEAFWIIIGILIKKNSNKTIH